MTTGWLLEPVDAAMKDIGIEDYEIVNRFSGADLELTEFKHPFAERNPIGIMCDHVNLKQVLVAYIK